jgi:pentafunctional AROM polypeptide
LCKKADLVDALTQSGIKIDYLEQKGSLPIRIHSSGKGLVGGMIELSAQVSSQFVSSVLLSGPYASSSITLKLQGETIVSEPYIDMTIQLMKIFGIEVKKIDEKQVCYLI